MISRNSCYDPLVIRIIAFALLLAVMVPFGIGVRWLHDNIGQRGQDVWGGIVIGFLICSALWMWHERIVRRRQGNTSNLRD